MTRRQRIVLVVTAALVGLAVAGAIGVLSSYLNHRRQTDAHLTQLANDTKALANQAKTIAENNGRISEDIRSLLTTVESVTGPDAQARSAATLRQAIADLRRSIDCAKLADEATYPACIDVVARLDAIRAGLDPFARTTSGAP